MPVLLLIDDSPEQKRLSFFCPGCKCGHWFRVEGPQPRWWWNENMKVPTFQPSLLNEGQFRCHLNCVNGHLQFLPDCSHELAGKTVPMVEWDTVLKK